MTEPELDPSHLLMRIDELERLNREHLEFLDMLLSLDNSLVGIRHHGNHATMLGMICGHLRRLMPIGTTVFYLVDERDLSYEAAFSDPRDGLTEVDPLVSAEIDSGIFAWALRNNRALFRPAPHDHQLVLHPLATPSRTVGMLAAIWKAPEQSSAALMLLSIVMSTTAYALENARLQTELRDYNLKLELAVRERTEQAQQEARRADLASRAKSDFLSTISHELRTPMNGVLGMTSLLLATDLTPEQREYADKAFGCGQVMLDLVNDILDLSKIEAGQLVLQSVPFAPRTVLDDVLGVLAQRAEVKAIDLIAWVAGVVPELVLGDPSRLRQVLFNLVSNAVKFTTLGAVTVRLDLATETLHANASPNVQLRFVVTDTGVGIEPSDQRRLFQPFSQVTPVAARAEPGTGLGLAITRQLVTAMNGTIDLESSPGSGTRVTATVSLGRAVQAEASSVSDAIDGLHVLVLDDHDLRRNCLGEQLREWGCVVDGRASAIELQGPAGIPSVELVAVDSALWSQNEELLRAALNDGNGAIPVLMLCALGDARRSGPERYPGPMRTISRPPKTAELRRMIHELTRTGHAASAVETARSPDAAPPNDLLQGKRVLVVEDNAVNQMVAVGMLKRLGAETFLAENGSRALQILDEFPPDLVLMDCRMPVMDGYQTTREIRARESVHGGHVIIIGLTANAFAGDRELCLASGMDDYLAKPVTFAALRKVAEFLDG